jgi:hypothetical protein
MHHRKCCIVVPVLTPLVVARTSRASAGSGTIFSIFTSRLSQGLPHRYAFPCDNDVDPQPETPAGSGNFGLRGGFVFSKASTLTSFHIKADSTIGSLNTVSVDVPFVIYINSVPAQTVGFIPANTATFDLFNSLGFSVPIPAAARVSFVLDLSDATSGQVFGNFQAAFGFV